MPCAPCQKRKTTPKAYLVRVPGRPDQKVASESAAQQLTRGVRGASYRPVRTS